jgi:hypothetical protein
MIYLLGETLGQKDSKGVLETILGGEGPQQGSLA